MSTLFIGIFAGIIGTAYFVYGRKTTKPVPMLAGALLCIYPYFSDNWIWLCAVGLLLVAAPFVVEL